jgi:hypothetical protein
MAHKPFLDGIYEKADAGDTYAQDFLRSLSELSDRRGSHYWFMDAYTVPSEAEIHEQRSLQAERSRLRLQLLQRLM